MKSKILPPVSFVAFFVSSIKPPLLHDQSINYSGLHQEIHRTSLALCNYRVNESSSLAPITKPNINSNVTRGKQVLRPIASVATPQINSTLSVISILSISSIFTSDVMVALDKALLRMFAWKAYPEGVSSSDPVFWDS